jgi:predicted lysophospholipase L1 biosynthesis ABC-type transport system permease subunit
MRIVGRAVFAHGGDTPGDLDQGAQIRFSAFRRLAPDATMALVQFRVASSERAASITSRISAAVVPFPVHVPEPPTTITSFGRTNTLPSAVAAIMALVALATLAHALLTSVRRRRRDFAILETLGLERRQFSVTVGATATTFACVACLVGIPLGLIGGRWAWAAIASALGVPAEPAVNDATIVAIVVIMLLVANVVALVPAWMARRTRPATALRAE